MYVLSGGFASSFNCCSSTTRLQEKIKIKNNWIIKFHGISYSFLLRSCESGEVGDFASELGVREAAGRLAQMNNKQNKTPSHLGDMLHDKLRLSLKTAHKRVQIDQR